MKFSPVELNTEVAFLIQACLGEISKNFISISLIPADQEVILRFVLEVESDDDREAIQDIASNFYALHDNDPTVRVESIIDPAETIPQLQHPARVVYLRKIST